MSEQNDELAREYGRRHGAMVRDAKHLAELTQGKPRETEGPTPICSACRRALAYSETSHDWYFDCGCEPPRVKLEPRNP